MEHSPQNTRPLSATPQPTPPGNPTWPPRPAQHPAGLVVPGSPCVDTPTATSPGHAAPEASSSPPLRQSFLDTALTALTATLAIGVSSSMMVGASYIAELTGPRWLHAIGAVSGILAFESLCAAAEMVLEKLRFPSSGLSNLSERLLNLNMAMAGGAMTTVAGAGGASFLALGVALPYMGFSTSIGYGVLGTVGGVVAGAIGVGFLAVAFYDLGPRAMRCLARAFARTTRTESAEEKESKR